MKDVKKLLKAQSKHILPDEGVKENIRRELGYSDAEQSAAYAHGGTERFGRKGIISLIAAGLALVLCLCIVLPVVLLHRNPSAPGLIGGGTLNSIDTADEFYAYGARVGGQHPFGGAFAGEQERAGSAGRRSPFSRRAAAFRRSDGRGTGDRRNRKRIPRVGGRLAFGRGDRIHRRRTRAGRVRLPLSHDGDRAGYAGRFRAVYDVLRQNTHRQRNGRR